MVGNVLLAVTRPKRTDHKESMVIGLGSAAFRTVNPG